MLEEDINNMKKFLIELKQKIRNSGRTNVISVNEIDLLFVKHNINIRNLKEDNGN